MIMELDSRHRGEPKRAKRLTTIMEIIDRAVKELGLPREAVDEARTVCLEAVSKGLDRWVSPEDVATACVYIAYRNAGRGLLDINDIIKTLFPNISLYDVRRIRHAVARILKRLGVRVRTPPPESIVREIAEELAGAGTGVDAQKIVEEASKMIYEFRKKRPSTGGDPRSIASACVYIACERLGYGVSKAEIARIAGITDASIRNWVKLIAETLGLNHAGQETDKSTPAPHMCIHMDIYSHTSSSLDMYTYGDADAICESVE